MTKLIVLAALVCIVVVMLPSATSVVEMIEAGRTERVQLRETALTERARIDAEARMWVAAEGAATARLALTYALVGLVVVAAVGVLGMGVVVARQILLTPPARLRALSQRMPDHTIEWHPADGWVLVDDDGAYYTEPDARLLLENRQKI
jgi:hypothetical protein